MKKRRAYGLVRDYEYDLAFGRLSCLSAKDNIFWVIARNTAEEEDEEEKEEQEEEEETEGYSSVNFPHRLASTPPFVVEGRLLLL